MTRLLRIALNVSDPARLTNFYRDAIGFAPLSPTRLTLGSQQIELIAPNQPGAPYPADSTAADLWFQHFAIIVTDIAAAYARLQRHGATPITHGEPVRLPATSGGVTCYKFRDPDGHPLELIEGTTPGIDHSAISVANADHSIAFYKNLGLSLGSCQRNTGPEQDRLDGLAGTSVNVVALMTADGPHVELLNYEIPRGRAQTLHANDIAATHLVFGGSANVAHMQDPDGHFITITKTGQDSPSAGNSIDPKMDQRNLRSATPWTGPLKAEP